MIPFKHLMRIIPYFYSYFIDEDLEKCVSVLLDGVEYELIFLDDPLPVDNMVSTL